MGVLDRYTTGPSIVGPGPIEGVAEAQPPAGGGAVARYAAPSPPTPGPRPAPAGPWSPLPGRPDDRPTAAAAVETAGPAPAGPWSPLPGRPDDGDAAAETPPTAWGQRIYDARGLSGEPTYASGAERRAEDSDIAPGPPTAPPPVRTPGMPVEFDVPTMSEAERDAMYDPKIPGGFEAKAPPMLAELKANAPLFERLPETTDAESEIRRKTIRNFHKAIKAGRRVDDDEMSLGKLIAKHPQMKAWPDQLIDWAEKVTLGIGGEADVTNRGKLSDLVPADLLDAVQRERRIRAWMDHLRVKASKGSALMVGTPALLEATLSTLTSFYRWFFDATGIEAEQIEARDRLRAEANAKSTLNVRNLTHLLGSGGHLAAELAVVGKISPTSAAGILPKSHHAVRTVARASLESAGLFAKHQLAKQVISGSDIETIAKETARSAAFGMIIGPMGKVPLKWRFVSGPTLVMGVREATRLSGGSPEDIENATITAIGFEIYSMLRSAAFHSSPTAAKRKAIKAELKRLRKTMPAKFRTVTTDEFVAATLRAEAGLKHAARKAYRKGKADAQKLLKVRDGATDAEIRDAARAVRHGILKGKGGRAGDPTREMTRTVEKANAAEELLIGKGKISDATAAELGVRAAAHNAMKAAARQAQTRAAKARAKAGGAGEKAPGQSKWFKEAKAAAEYDSQRPRPAAAKDAKGTKGTKGTAAPAKTAQAAAETREGGPDTPPVKPTRPETKTDDAYANLPTQLKGMAGVKAKAAETPAKKGPKAAGGEALARLAVKRGDSPGLLKKLADNVRMHEGDEAADAFEAEVLKVRGGGERPSSNVQPDGPAGGRPSSKGTAEASGVKAEFDQFADEAMKAPQAAAETGVTVKESQFYGKKPGQSVTVKFVRNTEKAPDMGARFGQDVEPTGRYVNEASDDAIARIPEGWESGEVTFGNPLYVKWGGGYESADNWKRVLAKKYGATGEKLSRKILAEGYDGIVVVEEKGHTSEIVDLTGLEAKQPSKAKTPQKAEEPAKPKPMGKKKAQQAEAEKAAPETAKAGEGSELWTVRKADILPYEQRHQAPEGSVVYTDSAKQSISVVRRVDLDRVDFEEGNKIFAETVEKYQDDPGDTRPVLYLDSETGRYMIDDGHHRVVAAKERGETSIVAIVRPGLTGGRPHPRLSTLEGQAEAAIRRGDIDSHPDYPELNSPEAERARAESYVEVGDLVDGRTIRDPNNVPNTDSISASLTDYTVLPGIREVPLSDFGLSGKHYSVQGTNAIRELQEQIQESKDIAPLIVVVDAEGPYILEGATRAEALFNIQAKSFPAMVVIDEGSLARAAKAAKPKQPSEAKKARVAADLRRKMDKINRANRRAARIAELTAKKRTELVAEARKRGLKVGGNKKTLAERIADAEIAATEKTETAPPPAESEADKGSPMRRKLHSIATERIGGQAADDVMRIWDAAAATWTERTGRSDDFYEHVLSEIRTGESAGETGLGQAGLFDQGGETDLFGNPTARPLTGKQGTLIGKGEMTEQGVGRVDISDELERAAMAALKKSGFRIDDPKDLVLALKAEHRDAADAMFANPTAPLPEAAEALLRATKGRSLFQDAETAEQADRGAVEFVEAGKAILHLFEAADASTFLHEQLHILRRLPGMLTAEEQAVLEQYAGVKDGKWTAEAEEKVAKAWEKYFQGGKAPDDMPGLKAVFKRLAAMLRRIYNAVRNRVKVSPEVKAVFDRMLGSKRTIKQAIEKARRRQADRKASREAKKIEGDMIRWHEEHFGEAIDADRDAARGEVDGGEQYGHDTLPTTFNDKIPTELKEALGGKFHLMRMLRVLRPGDSGYKQGLGADGLGTLGTDEYVRRLEILAAGAKGDLNRAADRIEAAAVSGAFNYGTPDADALKMVRRWRMLRNGGGEMLDEKPDLGDVEGRIREAWGDQADEILRQRAVEYEKNLVALHNMTAENLAHADEIGGLPVPSVAVTKKDIPFDKYGEITLIAPRQLVDPAESSANKVYDSDAYTVRTPPKIWSRVPTAAADEVMARVRDAMDYVDDSTGRGQLWDHMVNQPDRDEAVRHLKGSHGARLAFLREKGINVRRAMRDKEPPDGYAWADSPAVREKAAELARRGFSLVGIDGRSPEYKELSAAVRKGVRQYWRENLPGEAELAADMIEQDIEEMFDEDGLLHFGKTTRLAEAVEIARTRPREVDFYKTRERVDKKMTKKLTAEFEAWADELMAGRFKPPKMALGRRKVDYTLGNMVAAMTRVPGRASESNLTFSPGQARAAGAKEFRNVGQMHKDAGRLAAKEDVQAFLDGPQKEALAEYHRLITSKYKYKNWRGEVDTWNALDDSMRAVGEFIRQKNNSPARMRAALSRNGFENFGDEEVTAAIAAADVLRDAPTQYFEAKPRRAVTLDEFVGAVIPSNAKPETRALLEKHGIPYRVYKYRNPESRQKAVERFHKAPDVLFQRGRKPKTPFSQPGKSQRAEAARRRAERQKALMREKKGSMTGRALRWIRKETLNLIEPMKRVDISLGKDLSARVISWAHEPEAGLVAWENMPLEGLTTPQADRAGLEGMTLREVRSAARQIHIDDRGPKKKVIDRILAEQGRMAEATRDVGGATIREWERDIGELPEAWQEDMLLVRGTPATGEGDALQAESRANMPEYLQSSATTLKAISDDIWKLAHEVTEGEIGYVESYFFGAYKDSPDGQRTVDSFMEYYRTSDRFAKEKTWPTYADAMAFGLQLKETNPVTNLRREMAAVMRLKAMIELRADLLASGGEKYIIRLGDKAAAVQADEFGAFQKIRDPVFDGYMVHPDLAHVVNNLIRVNQVSVNKWLRGLRGLANFGRSIKFAGSIFHMKTIAIQSLIDSGGYGAWLNPVTFGRNVKKLMTTGFKEDDPAYKTAEYHRYVRLGGGHHGSAEYAAQEWMDRLLRGKDANWLWKAGRLPVRAATAPFREYTRWLFKRWIPYVKYQKYLETVARAERKHGRELTDAEHVEIIKEGANFYGMQNEKMFGRSAGMTSALRLWFSAPGFGEGNYRTMYKAVGQTHAGRSRANIPNFMLFTFLVASTITYLMTGETPEMPENFDEFRDLFKAKTGWKDAKGREVMVDMMSVDKDYLEQLIRPSWIAVTGRPIDASGDFVSTFFKRIGHMKASHLGPIADAYHLSSGEAVVDWKGDKVVYLTDPFLTKLQKLSIRWLREFQPISAGVAERMITQNVAPTTALITAVMGIRPTLSEKDRRVNMIARDVWELQTNKDEMLWGLVKMRDPWGAIADFNELVDQVRAHPMMTDELAARLDKLRIDPNRLVVNKIKQLTARTVDEKRRERVINWLDRMGVDVDDAESRLNADMRESYKDSTVKPGEQRKRIDAKIRRFRARVEGVETDELMRSAVAWLAEPSVTDAKAAELLAKMHRQGITTWTKALRMLKRHQHRRNTPQKSARTAMQRLKRRWKSPKKKAD